MTSRALASALVTLVVATTVDTGIARAETRLAVVIGSNRGDPDEALLRFAERDAQRIADVLTRLGGVRPENLLLLLSPTPGALGDALEAFGHRLERSEEAGGATLFVYYSGHADRNALHLSGERFGFSELKAAARGIGTDLTVIVIDACRSGGIVTSKGTRRAAPFTFDVRDEVRAEGLAIITSSAEDEDALESERLQGGVFTHHLLTGMLGAADEIADEVVTLAEAFRYAYGQTVAATSDMDVVQHPSYAFQVRGHDEVTLTRLADVAGRGRLHLATAGRYVVIERFGARAIAAELEGRAGAVLSLAPGPYLVRRRGSSAVFETEVDVAAGGTTTVGDEGMSRVPYRYAVRKGFGLSERRVVSLGLDGEVASGVLPDTGLVWLGALALQVDWAELALRVRLRFGRGSHANDTIGFTQQVLGTDAAIYHLFDIGRHGFGFGLRAGVDWLAQRFTTDRLAPGVDQVIGRVGPFARGELALGGAVTLQLDAGLEVYVLELRDGDASAVEARVVPTVTLGVGVLLP